MRSWCATVALLLAARAAVADPVVIRYGTQAPEGTAWARELKSYAREAEADHSSLKVKIYFGGVAGDEVSVLDRIRRGQLDGGLAAITCERLGPSLKVLRVPGLFRNRAEANHVIDRLRPRVADEFRKNGFALISLTWFGTDVIFSKEPVRSFEDLKRMRFWIWDLDRVWAAQMTQLGLKVVPMPVDEAGKALEDGRVDGLLALPAAALAFQWSARSRAFTNLPLAVMPGCNFLANRVFDALPLSSQSSVRTAGAKLNFRFDDVNAALEDALLGRLFARQGVQPQPPSNAFKMAFLEAARLARDKLPEELVPRALVAEVLTWLSDFRASPH